MRRRILARSIMHNITSNIHTVVPSYVECIIMIYARILHVL